MIPFQICLFEFLTGVPPFCDETIDLIFKNVLNQNIDWPTGDEELSPHAVHCIKSMLSHDPSTRPDLEALKNFELFMVGMLEPCHYYYENF